jgi:hypothetical protein
MQTHTRRTCPTPSLNFLDAGPTQSRHTHSLNVITITDKQHHNRILNVTLVTIGKRVDCAKTVKTEQPKTADKNESV